MVRIPTKRERIRFRFRLYTIGCSLAGLVVLTGLVLLGVWSWRSETRLVLRPAEAPTALAPWLLPDRDVPAAPPPNPALADEVAGRTHNAATRTITLSVPGGGEVPTALAPLLQRRYRSFAEAYADARTVEPPVPLLVSTDALLHKAATIEEGVMVALERLFVQGERSAGVPPLAHVLAGLDAALDTLAAAATPGRGPSSLGIAQARAYLGLALAFLDTDAQLGDPARVRALRETFLASRLMSEPRGLWTTNAERQREYQALRALMYPLQPDGALALRAALRHDAAAGGGLLAHYRRWLAVLDRLHGRAFGPQTVADLLNSGREPNGPVSWLPYRRHEPADLLVLATQRARDDHIQAAADGDDALAVRLAQAELVANGVPLEAHDANWRQARLWARAPILPASLDPEPGPYTASYKVRSDARYKLLRLLGRGPEWDTRTVVGFEVLGFELFGWRRGDARLPRPPLALEPSADVLLRLHHVAWMLPQLLQRELDRATLRRIRCIEPDGVAGEASVLERLEQAATFFAALYTRQASELGIRPGPLAGGQPGEAARANAGRWLREGLTTDEDMGRDVRHVWPLGFAAESDALLWLGVRGAVLQPLRLTVRETGEPEAEGTQYVALVAVPERLLQTTASHRLPSNEWWHLVGHRLPAELLRHTTR